MKPRVAVCVPTAGMVHADFMVSVVRLMRRTGVEKELFIQKGSSIAANRTALWEQAERWGASHVFFIDDDMVFGPSIVSRLLARNKWSVGANYPMRSENYSFTAMDLDCENRIETDLKKTGLEQCKYLPMGCSLTKMSYLDELTLPLWDTRWHDADKSYKTEDVFFYAKAEEELGLHPYVDHDVSRQVGHIGTRIYNWLDVLTKPSSLEIA